MLYNIILYLMGTIEINNAEELAELTQLLFGNREFILINEPANDTIDYTDENIIFI